ncbi:MAG TPA: hypothetical protein VFE61_02830 [Candidatus Sulfotelmatobacter sp.]|jgi:predicted lysophospholipase L1 biosynthesis ABC-type transport system permease subunit|nr:hypothetical protein [Candidatus Sulfotelmatobacter sp.]
MKKKPNYTAWGLSLGAGLGTAVGVMAGNIGVWLALGVAIGMVLGASFRRKGTDCPDCAEIHRAHEVRRQA